jgi:hypothetical protein
MALVVISSAFLLAVAGCSKSSNSNSSTGITASVAGSAWASNYPVEGTYISALGQFEVGGVQVKGGDTTAFAILFDAPFSLNKAMNSASANVDVQYVDEKTQLSYDGGSAAGWSIITITSYDSVGHKVGGTFSGVVYDIGLSGNDSLVITNGTFNTSYTPQ